MKKILLLLFLFVLMFKIDVNAVYFYYNDDYVEDMWITRSDGRVFLSGNPYILKRKDKNQYVYCVEPLNLLNMNEEYILYSYNDPIFNISNEKLKKITLIAHYGYEYKNHTDKKWYGVTQYLIWKELFPELDISFTDDRFGNKITAYTSEINEILTLVNHDLLGLGFKENYLVTTDKEYTLIDNDLIHNYTINTNIPYEIKGNKFIIKPNVSGEFKVTLERKKFNRQMYLAYIQTGQNLFYYGDINETISFDVVVKTENLKVIKKDIKENDNSNITLKGAIYGLYDLDHNLIISKSTDEDGEIIFENLPIKKYYLKEIIPSYGYLLDSKVYEIDLEKSTNQIVYENRIEKRITIKKKYRNDDILYDEEGATFYLYKDGELVDEYETDETGLITLYLEYGKYKLVQTDGKKGFCFSDDYEFIVDENFSNDEILIINEPLDDIEIKVLGVEDTLKNYNYNFSFIFLILLILNIEKNIINRFI